MRVDEVLLLNKTNSLFIEVPLLVNTYDIDVAGHVNNIVYVRWLEDMRNILFTQIYAMEKLLEINHHLVVISSEIKYRKQIKLFDKPVGKMFVHSYSHGMFIFKAEIKIEDHLAFVATQKCVLMNLNKNKMFTGNIHNLVEQN
ncbi:MAG: thioesterase family protein [Ignavibacteriaceae bacterium]